MDVREKLVELLRGAVHINSENVEKWILGGKQGEIPNIFNTQADHLIDHGVTVQECISVNERFPCVDTTVLAYDAVKGDTHTATFDGTLWHLDGGWLLDADDFTHWMPLPQPPKGE